MPIDETMTLEDAIRELHHIKNIQRTVQQDAAVKYAIAVLETLRDSGDVIWPSDYKGLQS